MGLSRRAFTGLAQMIVAFGVFLFVPAWSLAFWQAWLYWLLFSLCCFLITLYFLKYDPALIEARLHAGPVAEKERSQRIIQALASVCVCLVLILPGIERHFQESLVSPALTLAADDVVVLGFVIPAVLLCAVIVWRLLDEEKYLGKNLAGYEEYRRKVRRRLIPFIW